MKIIKQYKNGDNFVQLGYNYEDEKYYIRNTESPNWVIAGLSKNWAQTKINDRFGEDNEEEAFEQFDIICKYYNDKAISKSKQNQQIDKKQQNSMKNFDQLYNDIILQYQVYVDENGVAHDDQGEQWYTGSGNHTNRIYGGHETKYLSPNPSYYYKQSYGTCPKCGGALYKKNGKYGPFVGCSRYPACKYTQNF